MADEFALQRTNHPADTSMLTTRARSSLIERGRRDVLNLSSEASVARGESSPPNSETGKWTEEQKDRILGYLKGELEREESHRSPANERVGSFEELLKLDPKKVTGPITILPRQ